MPPIKLNPAAGDVNLRFDFETDQIFTFNWRIVDAAGKVLQSGTGDWKGKVDFDLGDPGTLIGNEVDTFWTVDDPQGAGRPYKATATAIQQGIACQAVQTIKGTTTSAPLNDDTDALFTT